MPSPSSHASTAWPCLEDALRKAPDGVTTGVSVLHLGAGTRFERGARLVFPAASTIKLVILVALSRAIDAGRLDPAQLAATGPGTKVGGSGVLNWLADALELTLRDHAWLMIAISDNTASNVLIDVVGLPAIADAQRALGLASTALNRRFLGRLPDAGESENVTCAGDLVRVLAAIGGNTAASPERCAWMRELLAEQQHLDRIARHLPDGVTFAGKSGSLNRLAHDCGLLTGPGGEVAMAVLTQGFDDDHEADAFIGTIGKTVIDDTALAAGTLGG